MFCWEPEGRYHHRLCTAIVAFWFSTEHPWIMIMPFWLYYAYVSCVKIRFIYLGNTSILQPCGVCFFSPFLTSQHLGAFGPLKLKETIALDKLQKQAVIIEQLIVLAVSGIHVTSADEGSVEMMIRLIGKGERASRVQTFAISNLLSIYNMQSQAYYLPRHLQPWSQI